MAFVCAVGTTGELARLDESAAGAPKSARQQPLEQLQDLGLLYAQSVGAPCPVRRFHLPHRGVPPRALFCGCAASSPVRAHFVIERV